MFPPHILLLLGLVAAVSPSTALPHTRRITQMIWDSTARWERACTIAGGSHKCNPISMIASSALLFDADPCNQQNAADSMIDFAKSLNIDSDMIRLVQIFSQQPRDTPGSFSVPYCQQAPKNAELNGLFQCQFQGVKGVFVGNLQPGALGTIPFGLDEPVSPPGSCPPHTSGGIPDGTQLVDLVGSSGNSIDDSGKASDDSNDSCTDNEDGSTKAIPSAMASIKRDPPTFAQFLGFLGAVIGLVYSAIILLEKLGFNFKCTAGSTIPSLGGLNDSSSTEDIVLTDVPIDTSSTSDTPCQEDRMSCMDCSSFALCLVACRSMCDLGCTAFVLLKQLGIAFAELMTKCFVHFGGSKEMMDTTQPDEPSVGV